MTTLDSQVLDRVRGVLVGKAVGDALGAPVEFDPPEKIAGLREQLFEFPGGGGWNPGEFTDDTEMSILLAQHLIAGKFDEQELASSWAEWATNASTKDVGFQTGEVLSAVARGQHWSVAVDGLPRDAAGNGSLMRVAPVALFQLAGSIEIADLARAQSQITHPNDWCQESCVAFSAALRFLLMSGEQPEMQYVQASTPNIDVRDRIARAWLDEPPQASGFVLDTLTVGLWAARAADNFDDAVWNAVSRGVDADTSAAVAGALAGARFGASGIKHGDESAFKSAHPLFRTVDRAYLESAAEKLATLALVE